MERIIGELLDWKLQFKDIKTLIFTGSTEEDRTAVIKAFAMRYFENMIYINLKNNEKIREYINNNPPGRDAYYFIEKAVIDIIVPLESILIFNNAHVCDKTMLMQYARNFFLPEDMGFLVMTGDFSDDFLNEAREYCIIITLPDPADK